MDLRQLRTFLLIIRTGSFQRATQQAYISSSAVSQQIKALEDEVGHQLFDHSSRPPTLTTAGLQFLRLAEQILDLSDTAISSLRGEGISGVLSLGSVRSGRYQADPDFSRTWRPHRRTALNA